MSNWIHPTLLTFELIAISVAIAGTLGTIGAWASHVLGRGTPFQKKLNQLILATHVMIVFSPLILHAVAWESTAGKFGITMLTQTGVRVSAGGSYSFFAGLIATSWIHGITGASLVCAVTYIGTSRLPGAMIERGRLEMGDHRLWWRLRLPLAKNWWIGSLLATAMLAATEMTIADLYGCRTLADHFYLLYAANPDLKSILITCIVPLIILVGGSLWWVTSRQRPLGVISRIDGEQGPERKTFHQISESPSDAGIIKSLALTVSLSLVILTVFVPLVSLLLKLGQTVQLIDGNVASGWSISVLFDRLLEAPLIFQGEYTWTLILASFTGTLALLIAWPMAAFGRTAPALRRCFDFSTLTLAVIPGPVIAILIIEMFQVSVPGFATLYQRSVVPTSMSLLARALPLAYWVLRVGYSTVPDQLLEAAALEHGTLRRLIRMDRKLIGGFLIQAWLASSLFASGDVPASLPILPPGMTTVGSRLFGLLHSGARFQEAALAFWYLLAIALLGWSLIRLVDKIDHGTGRAK